MKFTVEVDETILRTTTYLVKARSKKEAFNKVADKRWDEMKQIETFDHDGSIDDIHSVKPFMKK